VVSVGDKWIGNFDGGELLVGLEISGHLIFPVTFTNEAGKEVSLLSGIGLLTGLMTLAAIKELGLPPERVIRPFEPGVSKTFYVFFVDKTKFYRNSDVWTADSDLVRREVRRLKEEKKLPADVEIVFEEKEDPNVLYINLVNPDGIQGCIFMRNSGTEDKTATYVQGKGAIKDALYELGQKVQDNHTALMKNEKRIEYAYETFIMNILKEKPEMLFGVMKAALERETRTTINESDLFSVVYGLKKEGRIVLDDQVLKLSNTWCAL
jgi:phosphomannomutase